ncbi:MAG: ParB/RepB/Spo0J family partition protein [Myxococcota bacterium]
MTTRRNALGRGLGALIPTAPRPTLREAGDASFSADPTEISVDTIDPNPEQPRRNFAPEQLASLAESVRRHGVLQPVVVRRSSAGRYELVVGERRWRAARAAGLSTIPVVLSDAAPQARLELALVENVQRHDLNPIELAHAFRALADGGATQQEIAERVGLDRSTVANHLRLLELTLEIQGDLEAGKLSMGHAKALLQVSHPERRRRLRDQIVQSGLSVRQAEQRGRQLAGPAAKRAPRADAADSDLGPLLEQLRQRFQTRVRIRGNIERGRLELEYFSTEELRRLAAMLLEGKD